MKKLSSTILFLAIISLMHASAFAQKQQVKPNEYAVVVNRALAQDSEWMKVVEELRVKHNAEVVVFEKHPEEVAETLKTIFPRYVALVEKMENITREYAQKMHKLSRRMDDDIFQDFLWGIITGNDAGSALQMVRDAETPLVIKNAMDMNADIKKYSCFEHSLFVDDNYWGKILYDKNHHETGEVIYYSQWTDMQKQDTLNTDTLTIEEFPRRFIEKYQSLNPELIIGNLKVNQGKMNIFQYLLKGKDGRLYMDNKKQNGKKVYLPKMDARRVFLNMYYPNGTTRETADLMQAWFRNGNVSALGCYAHSRWHGQAAWGTWKLWMSHPGKFSFSEAVYLNQQLILSSLHDLNSKLVEIDYPLTEEVTKDYLAQREQVMQEIGQEIGITDMGYLNERDIFVYYGDPKWDAKLEDASEEVHYKVTSKRKGKKCIITIQTDEHFQRQDMEGFRFKEDPGLFGNEPVICRLPFVYFFPERLKNPRLAKETDFEGDIELDENFLFIHRSYLEPSQTYTIVLSADKN